MRTSELQIENLKLHYERGSLTPETIIESICDQIRSKPINPVWTYVLSEKEIKQQLESLKSRLGKTQQPLYGVPFAIKDNMDLEGHPTTAGCPDYGSVPEATAPVVKKLLDAGAILIGKTAMDQFATGTTGTRSAYGPCPSALDSEYVAGGSSSGSAVSVASGLVSFALGTDTAGSGRIPAALNRIVGLKPTIGRVSIRGIVPACRSIDCVAVFAQTITDAGRVLQLIEGFDEAEPYSRPIAQSKRKIASSLNDAVVAIPDSKNLEFFGCEQSRAAFASTIEDLRKRAARVVEVDFRPFREVAQMIYSGPRMAERYASVGAFLESHPKSVHPVTYKVISSAAKYTATEQFAVEHRLKELKRTIEPMWKDVDVLVTPTTPRTYKIAEVLEQPYVLNNNLAYYTNFVNLLDLCAVAIPSRHGPANLPIGLTFVAPAWNDNAVCRLAQQYQSDGSRVGAPMLVD
jgi:allophanate hydrolase